MSEPGCHDPSRLPFQAIFGPMPHSDPDLVGHRILNEVDTASIMKFTMLLYLGYV
jgi:hypothetical protein